MMGGGQIDTPVAAFVAGVVTSLHCAGMCGPVACWLTPTQRGEDAATVYSVYHGTRIVGYGLLGAVAGLVGQGPMVLLGNSAVRYAPWALVLFFLAVAFRWDKRLPQNGFLMRFWLRLRQRLHGRSRLATAAVLGGATPLLPCGPLYLLVALAALTGSALRGVEFMVAFGLGTLPLLWVVQANFGWLRVRLSPQWMTRIQVTLAILAALAITWRLRGTIGFGEAGIGVSTPCCH